MNFFNANHFVKILPQKIKMEFLQYYEKFF
jgi:hypothetical protein